MIEFVRPSYSWRNLSRRVSSLRFRASLALIDQLISVQFFLILHTSLVCLIGVWWFVWLKIFLYTFVISFNRDLLTRFCSIIFSILFICYDCDCNLFSICVYRSWRYTLFRLFHLRRHDILDVYTSFHHCFVFDLCLCLLCYLWEILLKVRCSPEQYYSVKVLYQWTLVYTVELCDMWWSFLCIEVLCWWSFGILWWVFFW